MGLRIMPSQSAHSPQSPRKVRNSANIGCRRPTMLNDERAAQMRVPSISPHSRTPRVSSGSTSPAGGAWPPRPQRADRDDPRRRRARRPGRADAAHLGSRLDVSTPFVDAMLPDGSRLHVAIPLFSRSAVMWLARGATAPAGKQPDPQGGSAVG